MSGRQSHWPQQTQTRFRVASIRNGTSEILSAARAVASNETPVSADMVRSLVRQDYPEIGSDLTELKLEFLQIAAMGKQQQRDSHQAVPECEHGAQSRAARAEQD
jgi:hypothetical protein